jgi:hypothetical protein
MSRAFQSSFRSSLLAALLALAPVSLAHSETVHGNCTVNAMAFSNSDEGLVTTRQANSPQAIPGTRVNFVQGGTKPDCVIVQFSSLANTTTTNASFIYFELDGVQHNQLYANKLNVAQTGVYTVVDEFADVTPGPHTLQMRLVSSDGVGVSVDLTHVLVHYRK